MAFPAIAASLNATPEGAYGSSNYAPSIAALGAVAGDLLIAFVGCSVDAARNYPAPSGWTQLEQLFGNSGYELYCFYKVAAGSDTFTLVKTGGAAACSAVFYRITGAGASPSLAVAELSSFGATCDPPSLAPGWGAEDILWLAAAHLDKTSVTAYPSSYSLGQTVSANPGTTYLTAAAARQLNASTENPGAFDFGGVAYSQSFTVAVRPAAAAVTEIVLGPFMSSGTQWAAGTSVHYSWFEGGRIGSFTGITPVEGSGLLDASGELVITGLAAAPGLALVAKRNAGATTDSVFYQAGTPAVP